MAGIVGFHPHRLRHTAAHRWPAAGGSEGGLMAGEFTASDPHNSESSGRAAVEVVAHTDA
jgi:hypothetical protein